MLASPPKETPRKVRTVARGRLPAGAPFTITGEREAGEYAHTTFTAELQAEGGVGFGVFRGGGILSAVGNLPGRKPSPFNRQMQEGCSPSEYAIVFGVLSAPRDTVLVRSGGVLIRLHRARIPAALRVKGALAYIALPSVPSEVIVRSPSGKTVSTERLGGEAREAGKFLAELRSQRAKRRK